MYTSLKFLSIAALAGLAAANNVKIVIKNQCDYDLQLGKLDNNSPTSESSYLGRGDTKTYSLDGKWQGRFWGREVGQDDAIAGAASPASLAEFTFKGHANYDFYDISFVDGYNIPMGITPIDPHEEDGQDKYYCGSPVCSDLPSCPDHLKVYEDGQEVGCKSACSKYGTDEYCCAGDHDVPEKCPPSDYSKDVKGSCPDVYTYAYDDLESTFMCQSKGYTVTFCP